VALNAPGPRTGCGTQPAAVAACLSLWKRDILAVGKQNFCGHKGFGNFRFCYESNLNWTKRCGGKKENYSTE